MVAPLATAEEVRKLPTIGLAIPVDPVSDALNQKAFREGLQALGWVDGQNVILVVRYSNGDPAKYREIIRELIALRVDVLWGEARELKEATSTIPIVSPSMDFGDPVRVGLVASLSRPGGNLTGPATNREDLDPKLLELSRELLPALKRLCVLFDDSPERHLAEYINTSVRTHARQLGLSLCTIPIRTIEDVRVLPRTVAQKRAQAIVLWSSPFIFQHSRTISESIAHRLPVVADGRGPSSAAILLSYSVDWLDMFRRSAAYVDKILKGAKPGEQPTKYRLVVNLKTAKELRIKVPETILVRADETIR
jgi:putative tryptophan/tyrosine transport system substrate-binding protein